MVRRSRSAHCFQDCVGARSGDCVMRALSAASTCVRFGTLVRWLVTRLRARSWFSMHVELIERRGRIGLPRFDLTCLHAQRSPRLVRSPLAVRCEAQHLLAHRRIANAGGDDAASSRARPPRSTVSPAFVGSSHAPPAFARARGIAATTAGRVRRVGSDQRRRCEPLLTSARARPAAPGAAKLIQTRGP